MGAARIRGCLLGECISTYSSIVPLKITSRLDRDSALIICLCARICLIPLLLVHMVLAIWSFPQLLLSTSYLSDQSSHTFAMYSRHILFIFVYLSFALASVLPSDSVLQLLSNSSLSVTGPSNHTLNAWPPRLPWTMRLSGDLSIDVTWYGEYAPRSRWNAIKKALEGMIRQIDEEQGGPDENIGQFSYMGKSTRVNFFSDTAYLPPFEYDPHISRRDAVKVLKTTTDLFFVYKDNPREFRAQIDIQRQRRVDMLIVWDHETPWAWPERLPFIINLPPFRNREWCMALEWYGRGVDPPLANEVREALGWFIHDFTREGPQTGTISKESYYHAFVKLHFDKLRPEGVTRVDMVQIVKKIRELLFTPHNWGPREFVTTLYDLHGGHLVEIALSFMPPPQQGAHVDG